MTAIKKQASKHMRSTSQHSHAELDSTGKQIENLIAQFTWRVQITCSSYRFFTFSAQHLQSGDTDSYGVHTFHRYRWSSHLEAEEAEEAGTHTYHQYHMITSYEVNTYLNERG